MVKDITYLIINYIAICFWKQIRNKWYINKGKNRQNKGKVICCD